MFRVSRRSAEFGKQKKEGTGQHIANGTENGFPPWTGLLFLSFVAQARLTPPY